jgi:hypothetical protein
MDHRNASPRGLGGDKSQLQNNRIRLRIHPNARLQTGATRLWPFFAFTGNNSWSGQNELDKAAASGIANHGCLLRVIARSKTAWPLPPTGWSGKENDAGLPKLL